MYCCAMKTPSSLSAKRKRIGSTCVNTKLYCENDLKKATYTSMGSACLIFARLFVEFGLCSIALISCRIALRESP